MLEPRFSLEFGYAQVEFDGFPLPRFQACFSESSRDAKKLRGWGPCAPVETSRRASLRMACQKYSGNMRGYLSRYKGPVPASHEGNNRGRSGTGISFVIIRHNIQ